MKSPLYLLAFTIAALFASCKAYDYLPNPAATITGNVPGLRCDNTVTKKTSVDLTAESKFFLFEVVNKGTCAGSVTANLQPANNAIVTKNIPAGQHYMYIGNVPAHNAGDKIEFTIGCPTDNDNNNCTLRFFPRICDQIKGKPANPEFTLEDSGDKTVTLPPATGNRCITPQGNEFEILVIENTTGQDHLITFTVNSKCLCPEFHIEPPNPNAIAPPNGNAQVNGFPVKKNKKVTFKAFCGGLNVPNPSCIGNISAITIKPK